MPQTIRAYVDELRRVSITAGCCGHRWSESCHLMADTLQELERFRRALRLRRGWRHADHYDLTPAKRARAIELGAIEITSREMVELRRRLRLEGLSRALADFRDALDRRRNT